MWAEDDLGPGAPPCLQSYIEPVCGQVYIMYHGTSREAAEIIKRSGFKQSSGGMLGRGVYLSRDLQKASRYPLNLPENQRVVLRVRVNVGKVKKIDIKVIHCRKPGMMKATTLPGALQIVAWCQASLKKTVSGIQIKSHSLMKYAPKHKELKVPAVIEECFPLKCEIIPIV